MTSNRKVLTGLAVLIVLSLVVMPASVFAQEPTVGKARGNVLTYKITKPSKTRRYDFRVAEQTLTRPPRGTMWAFDPDGGNELWSVRVKCVRIPDGRDDIAFFAGPGTGKKHGKYVLVVAKGENNGNDNGEGAIAVRTTRNKRYYKYWCRNPSPHGVTKRWGVIRGEIFIRHDPL